MKRKASEAPYSELRKLLFCKDTTVEELGAHLGKTRQAISHRLNRKTPWTLDECYSILDWFYLPHSDLNKYFPKDGIA